MKKTSLILFLIISTKVLIANGWIHYFVYFETDCRNTTWKDKELLPVTQTKILIPKQFSDIEKNGDIGLYEAMLKRLEENNFFYKYVSIDYAFSDTCQQNVCDTIAFRLSDKLTDKQIQTIRNELTATVVHAGRFSQVLFKPEIDSVDNSIYYSIDSLDYPVFALLLNNSISQTAKNNRAPAISAVKNVPIDTVTITKTIVKNARFKPSNLNYILGALIILLLVPIATKHLKDK